MVSDQEHNKMVLNMHFLVDPMKVRLYSSAWSAEYTGCGPQSPQYRRTFQRIKMRRMLCMHTE